jgi:hypothetical protein
MPHEWFRVAVETSVQLAFAILPSAPLLGRKLPPIGVLLSTVNTGDVERIAQASIVRPGFRASSALVGADETSAGWP